MLLTVVVSSHAATTYKHTFADALSFLRTALCNRQHSETARVHFFSGRCQKGTALCGSQKGGTCRCDWMVASLLQQLAPAAVSPYVLSLINSGFCIVVHAGLASRHVNSLSRHSGRIPVPSAIRLPHFMTQPCDCGSMRPHCLVSAPTSRNVCSTSYGDHRPQRVMCPFSFAGIVETLNSRLSSISRVLLTRH
jgi:hypothetical protein